MDSEGTTSGTTRTGGLSGLSALLPGTGIAGSYRESPTMNGQISVQASEEETRERDEGEKEERESGSEPKLFRISSVGSSEFSTSGPPVNKPIIHIQGESDGEGSPLFPRVSTAEKRRARELAGASLPPLLAPQGGSDSPRLGSSVEPSRGYGAIPVGIQTESGSRSPSPQRGRMRKTISGKYSVWFPAWMELWPHVNYPTLCISM